MSDEEPKYPEYAALLRSAIKDARSSRRKLSFALAAKTGNKQESDYRSLGKYLAGADQPKRERAAILAVLLNEPRLALVSDVGDRRHDRLAALEENFAEVVRVQGLLLDELALVVDEQGQLASRPSRDQDPRSGSIEKSSPQ